MNDKVIDGLYYFFSQMGVKTVSQSRLIKTLYLIDWTSAYKYGTLVFDVDWECEFYGPFCFDILHGMRSSSDFKVVKEDGTTFITLESEVPTHVGSLSDNDQKIIEYITQQTKNKELDDLILFIMNTYPVVISKDEKDENFDLIKIAKKRRKENA